MKTDMPTKEPVTFSLVREIAYAAGPLDDQVKVIGHYDPDS